MKRSSEKISTMFIRAATFFSERNCERRHNGEKRKRHIIRTSFITIISANVAETIVINLLVVCQQLQSKLHPTKLFEQLLLDEQALKLFAGCPPSIV
jgi:hypothetical protein